MMTGYEAGNAAGASVREEGGRWTLMFVRELKHSPAKVWRAITDPRELQAWAPFDPDRKLDATGPVQLTMAGPEPEVTSGHVRRAEAPRLLEYTWVGDVLRWEIEEIPGGCRLTLHHTVEDKSWLAKVTAGWHICIDVLERALDGRPVGRIVADAARKVGWEKLNAQYAEQFGMKA
jgi:uncharacterized protein YndB with AHSA1/START domain